MRPNAFSRHVFSCRRKHGVRTLKNQGISFPSIVNRATRTFVEQSDASSVSPRRPERGGQVHLGARDPSRAEDRARVVNADVIARDEGVSEIEAGRRTLARLDALVAARRDVAFETLASRTLLPRIQAMQRSGYVFHLTFFWLPSPDMAIERVAKRVAAGGHSIPEEVIRRGYERRTSSTCTCRWRIPGY